MKAIILLGCDGKIEKGFVFCRGVFNKILSLEKVKYSDNYDALLEYIKSVPKLHEGPCCKYSVIVNTIHKLYQFEMISETQHKYISSFINLHKSCGLVLAIRSDSEDPS